MPEGQQVEVPVQVPDSPQPPPVTGVVREEPREGENNVVQLRSEQEVSQSLRLQEFVELGVGVPLGELSDTTRAQYDRIIAGKNEDGSEISTEQRLVAFENFRQTLSQDPKLNDEQKTNLQNLENVLQAAIKEGKISPEDLVKGIQGMGELTELEKEETLNAMSDLGHEADQKKPSESKIKEIFNNIPKPVKLLLLAILAMFGLSIFKAFKASRGQGPGYMAA